MSLFCKLADGETVRISVSGDLAEVGVRGMRSITEGCVTLADLRWLPGVLTQTE